MIVDIQRHRLTVRLVWYGRVVDGPLYRKVKPSEACWSLYSTPLPTSTGAGAAAGSGGGGSNNTSSSKSKGSESSGGRGSNQKWSELIILLPKEDVGHYWRGLFEGGEEKSHFQVSRFGRHRWFCVLIEVW